MDRLVEFRIEAHVDELDILSLIHDALAVDDDAHVSTSISGSSVILSGSEKGIMSARRTIDDVLASLITVERMLVQDRDDGHQG